MGGQHVDAVAPGQHLGDRAVERRVIGVHDDLGVGGQHRIQPVVHRPADEGHAQRHLVGPFVADSLAATSTEGEP